MMSSGSLDIDFRNASAVPANSPRIEEGMPICC